MEEHITPVKETTKWVSSMVVSLKNDKVRLCIDPEDFKKAIKKEHYPIRNIDDVKASKSKHTGGKSVFCT